MIMVMYFYRGFGHDLFFSFCSKFSIELRKMTNTMVGKFVDEEWW